MKKKYFITAVLFTLFTGLAMAGCIEDCDGDPECIEACPIDGGVSILIGAGALYGFSKMKKK